MSVDLTQTSHTHVLAKGMEHPHVRHVLPVRQMDKATPGLLLRQQADQEIHRPWTPREEALLGKSPDAAVARKIGRTASAVWEHRHKLGLPNSCLSPRRPWTKAEEALLGTDADKVIAKKLGRTVVAVQMRRYRKSIRLHRHPRASRRGDSIGRPD